MNKYQVFGRPETGSDIIEYVCHELSIDYDFIEMDTDNIKNSTDLQKHNPLGRVPMIKLPNGEYMIESLAIIYHFLDKNNQLNSSFNDEEQAKFHEVMAFMSSSFYPVILLFYHPDQYVSANNENDLADKAKEIINIYLGFLEGMMDLYLIGDKISFADFYLFTLLSWLEEDSYLENYPKLTKFYNKMRKNQTIMSIKKKQNERKKN